VADEWAVGSEHPLGGRIDLDDPVVGVDDDHPVADGVDHLRVGNRREVDESVFDDGETETATHNHKPQGCRIERDKSRQKHGVQRQRREHAGCKQQGLSPIQRARRPDEQVDDEQRGSDYQQVAVGRMQPKRRTPLLVDADRGTRIEADEKQLARIYHDERGQQHRMDGQRGQQSSRDVLLAARVFKGEHEHRRQPDADAEIHPADAGDRHRWPRRGRDQQAGRPDGCRQTGKTQRQGGSLLAVSPEHHAGENCGHSGTQIHTSHCRARNSHRRIGILSGSSLYIALGDGRLPDGVKRSTNGSHASNR